MSSRGDMACLPDDIMKDILVRLPTKSLVRFRCVCKSWKSLLTCTSFVRAHLDRSLQSYGKSLLKYDNNGWSVVGFHYSGNHELSYLVPSSDQDLGKFYLVGSCNGVVCLSTFDENDHDQSKIFLWNPSIKESVALPPPHFHISEFIAFGFDPTSGHLDDFKVLNIKVSCRQIAEPSSQVELYSFRTNSWKQMGDIFPSWLDKYLGNQVIFGNFICWSPPTPIGQIYKQFVLFNVAEEVFQEMGFPSSMPTQDKYITLLDGCLSLIVQNSSSQSYEVWIMREFGIVSSWTKLYTTEVFADGILQYWPLGFASSDEIFFIKNFYVGLRYKSPTYVVLYNVGGRNLGEFEVEVDFSYTTRLVAYVESLVSVVSPSRIKNKGNYFE